jgi:hypothetical protein
MIVLCPSCHTRYRHAGTAAAATAHCSRCDGRFPLAAARRTYVLLPRTAARDAFRPRGMDDPGLARQLAGTAAAASGWPAAGGGVDLLGGAAGADGAVAASPFAPPLAQPRGLAVGLAVVFVPAAIGAGLAYTLAGAPGPDARSWSALGAAVGLLVGWGCLRWIRRRG